jgi:hypothetical protein
MLAPGDHMSTGNGPHLDGRAQASEGHDELGRIYVWHQLAETREGREYIIDYGRNSSNQTLTGEKPIMIVGVVEPTNS